MWQCWRADTIREELSDCCCRHGIIIGRWLVIQVFFSSCWETGDWFRRCNSCCSAAEGLERRSQEEDQEHGLREQDLDLLRGQGVEDLEQEERPRRLGDIRLVRGDVRWPQGDCHADEEGERRLGDGDTSLAGLLVMPAGDGWREREGHVLDWRLEAGERLRWWSVEEGEARWRWGPGLRLLTSGERDYGSRFSAVWTEVNGGQTMTKVCEVVCVTAHLYWTETDHLKSSWTWSNCPLSLTRTFAETVVMLCHQRSSAAAAHQGP